MRTQNTCTLIGWVVVIVLTGSTQAQAELIWTQKADMPTARMALSTSVVDGKIYAISALQGGPNRLTKVEAYDPSTDTWTRRADMPTTRDFLTTCVVGGLVYAIGGTEYWRGPYVATVEVYDPVMDTWTRKADMPTARSTSVAAVDGIIYAIGGYRNSVVTATVEAYDPVTDTWTQKADMPTARGLHSTRVVNGKIYALGGQTHSNFDAFDVVEMYDPKTDRWTRKGNMPAPRIFPTSTSVLDDKIYCFGGRATRGGSPLSQVFEYDTATDTWTEIGRLPVNNGGMGVSTVGRRIYVIGGSSSDYPFNSVLSTVWEFIPEPEFDFNGDGVVDAQDLSIMVDHWHTDSPRHDLAPFPAGDGIVDAQDLVTLSEHLFEDYRIIAHWRLDETEGDVAYDSVAENDALVLGDPLWLPGGGLVDGALQFDGVDDTIVTPRLLNPAEDLFSVFAWVQGDTPGQVIISQEDGANWLLTDAQGHLTSELISDAGRGAEPLVSETPVTDGDWHRVGITWDGSNRILYADDVAVAEGMQNNLVEATGDLSIGTGSNSAAGSFWSGMIDNVQVYDWAIVP